MKKNLMIVKIISIISSACLALLTCAVSAKTVRKFEVMIPLGQDREKNNLRLVPDGSRLIIWNGRQLQVNDKVYDPGNANCLGETLAWNRDGSDFHIVCVRENWGFFRETGWRIRQGMKYMSGCMFSYAGLSCLTGSTNLLGNISGMGHAGDGPRDDPAAKLRVAKNNNAYYFASADGNTSPFLSLDSVQGLDFQYSDDLKAYAFRFVRGSEHYVASNRGTRGPFDYVDQMKLSRDGARLFVQFRKQGKNYFLINKKEYGPFDEIACYDGSRCFRVRKDGYHYVQVNDTLYGPFKSAGPVASDRDGRNHAFLFTPCRDTPSSYRYGKQRLSGSSSYVQVNDTISGSFDETNLEKFQVFWGGKNPGGRESGYYSGGRFVSYGGPYISVYSRGLVTVQGQVVVEYRPGRSYYTFDLVYDNRNIGTIRGGITDMVISGDGKRILCLYEEINSHHKYFLADGKKHGPIVESYKKNYFISPGGTHFIFFSKDSCPVINGSRREPCHSEIDAPLFTPDEKKYVVKYSSIGKAYIRVNESVYGPYDSRYCDVGVTTDGRIFAAYVRDGAAYIDELF